MGMPGSSDPQGAIAWLVNPALMVGLKPLACNRWAARQLQWDNLQMLISPAVQALLVRSNPLLQYDADQLAPGQRY